MMMSGNPYREDAAKLKDSLPISSDLYSAMAQEIENLGEAKELYSVEDLFQFAVRLNQANTAAIVRLEALIRGLDVDFGGAGDDLGK